MIYYGCLKADHKTSVDNVMTHLEQAETYQYLLQNSGLIYPMHSSIPSTNFWAYMSFVFFLENR